MSNGFSFNVSTGRLLSALAAAWLVVAALILAVRDQTEAVYLSFAFLALVATVGIAQLIPWLAVILGVLAGAAYTAIPFLMPRTELNPPGFSPVGLIVFLLVGILAELTGRQLLQAERSIDLGQQLITELSPEDDELGTVKWPHARRTLAQEIARARRYSFPVSLVLLAVSDWEDVLERRGRDEMLQILQTIGRRLRSALREQDTLAYVGQGRFGMILTQTGLEGAHVVAERARAQVLNETRLTLRAGIAEFPNDAVTDETLMSEAEAALTVAESTGSPLMSRLLLSET